MVGLIFGYQEHFTTICLMVSLFSVLLFVFEQLFKRISLKEVNQTTSQDLHKAVIKNDTLKIFEIIQKKPQLINQTHCIDGYTPFMRACLTGNTVVVKLMLSFGANVSLKSFKGETPFFLATFHHVCNPEFKNASCIRALFYAGANINDANAEGHTPLDLAAAFGHTSLCVWLQEKGANIENSTKPYYLAKFRKHYNTAEVLKVKLMKNIQKIQY